MSSIKHEFNFVEIRVEFDPITEDAPVITRKKKKMPPSKVIRNRKRLERFLENTRNKCNGAAETNLKPGNFLGHLELNLALRHPSKLV